MPVEGRLGAALGGARRRLRDVRQGPDRLRQAVEPRSARCSAATPPEGFNYELFLDEKGQKISKSKGNGLTIDEWLAYASPESLALFMFQKPRAAKRLYFDVIPRAVDEYFAVPRRLSAAGLRRAARQSGLAHPFRRAAGRDDRRSRFAMLLNLVSAANAEDEAVLWGFITRHGRRSTPESAPAARRAGRLRGPLLPRLRQADEALPRARRGRARGARQARRRAWRRCRRTPTRRRSRTRSTMSAAASSATRTPTRPGPTAGRASRSTWFATLYQLLLGQERGPRFGSFVAIYGIPETRALIARALAGELVA